MKHTISVLVENHFGVLAHVAGLFSARGFNIDSLAVGETEDPTVSRMTIIAQGDDRTIEQITKQLNKLIDVIKVQDLTEEEKISRELVLIKAQTGAQNRSEVLQIVNTFRAKVVDVNPHSITVEVTGNEEKIDAILELLRPFGIKEVVRTGTIALSRKSELNLKGPKEAPEAKVEKPEKKITGKKK
ncbi:MAG: acetolactate synthase small subunit [Candidatus Omnitrophica bacterium]|nr:acetolactate synthase small subunit [Candidatus Omnitrophota bacterium]